MFFARVIIFIAFIASGTALGMRYGYAPAGAVAGAVLGILSIFLERGLKGLTLGAVSGGILGLFLGIVCAGLILYPLRFVLPDDARLPLSFALSAVLGYGGFFAGLARGVNLTVPSVTKLLRGQEAEEDLKLLDTSAIIDGRIVDIVEVGFLEGTFIVPQFILQELQYIADSPDPLRRTKGRRGLDMLHRMQKLSHITVRIVEEDFPKIREVDAKLIAVARLMHAKIITNDFNLNKVAQVQGLQVLNINELANVLKPVVLPGEVLTLFVTKEGKEYNQGVAYLDDGTMVVVENGRKLIGKSTDAVVTSVLQTTAGRMIFAKPKDEY